MMKNKQCYYECHITIEAGLEHRKEVRRIVESFKWSYSEHDEDHEIGPGLRCYANKSFKASEPVSTVIEETTRIQHDLDIQLGGFTTARVVRYKVEFVLHDVVYTGRLTTSGPHLQSRRNSAKSA